MLLADVFQNFRQTSLENYQLDPAHYYTLPGLGWDAMLKMGSVHLELLTDLDMHLMIEAGLRGGISMISKRYAKGNHPDLQTFQPDNPTSYIMYWDAYNLYGHAMSLCDFEWMNSQDIEKLDVRSIPADSKTCYILEVDLDYPRELPDSHSDHPLVPESMLISNDMLSPHSKELRNKLCIKGQPVRKLVPNLNDKTKYVLHYRNLQFYLSQGMKLVKIRRVIMFKQSPWLKPYIDFNTQKRKDAKNETEKAFFKLMNNSCFGRSMMNVRKHVNVELVNPAQRFRKLCAKPTFEAFKIFNDDLAAVHLKKPSLFLNQPLIAGFSILEMSKIVMYDFDNNFIKQK
ncbi:uncharacterized protein LOC124272613 [Haliotis rubra]|uniref:uncharacterized protein LOC124272613 n=1 Tax=Haliotis rubra TaxID=36100 RepID=UPI001EE53FE2|nr:uncharacterized protein LOC124272613 [Haliotis rubra]